jgi:hypothetical protein
MKSRILLLTILPSIVVLSLRVRVGPARGGTAPEARRFLHRAADRILPVATGARIPSRARAVADHQRCRHTQDAMSTTSQMCESIGLQQC